MAIVTDAWAENDPLGTDGFNTVDDAMQRLERRIRERANQGSHYWNHSTLARAGRHCLGTGSGIVGDGVDGEFQIYDEDALTKLLRLTNANAAILAADRNALILNWAVIKNLLVSGFVDGASTVFNLDTQVALVNVGGKLFRLANGGVEKLALDKDAKFLTANVGTAGLIANAVHPALSTTLGSALDVVIATIETVRITTSYTPVAGNVGIIITVNLPYEMSSSLDSSGGRVELRLYIGGVLKTKGILGGRMLEATVPFGPHEGTIAFTWIEPAMAASPTTIEVRDIRIDTAGAPIGTYLGTRYQGYLTLQELKK